MAVVSLFWSINGELKHATFLNHSRQPEVNISHARTMVSPAQIFQLFVSNCEKRLNNMNVVGWRQVE